MWKVFTHDYRSPIQRGAPVWDGAVPYELSSVEMDMSEAECAAGWNFCEEMATALRIGGLWPDGRPSVVVQVEPLGRHIQRGDKCRAEQLRLIRFATEEEIKVGIEVLSHPFGVHRQHMVDSQLAWRHALARPERAPERIPVLLAEALLCRDLDWKIVHYSSAQVAWKAWEDWSTWDARSARSAWDASGAWAAWAAWAARDAWAASGAWDAKGIWSALTWEYAVYMEWVDGDPLRLTSGIREAYRCGLEVVFPTGPQELGWAMTPEGEH